MNYQQIAKTNPAKLYTLRNKSNAKEIDALLDSLNRMPVKKNRCQIKNKMADYHTENNRWYIEDDGTIRNVSA